MIDRLRDAAQRVAAERAVGRWPSVRWQKDPVGFATLILGVRLWAFQVEFLEAIRDHRHVAVAGGRKIGKDFAVAVAALWWFASFELARVILLAPTAKQLDGIAYREIRMLFAQTGRCADCKFADPEGPRPCPHSAVLTGHAGMLARTGVRTDDFREIVGHTAISEGGLRGMSGARILAIEDEASDIKDEFDTALVGNLAGADCHRVLISNPTRTTGFFFRAFHDERHLYKTLQVSTETNPNVIEGRDAFRGLAGREWIAERELAWGRGSANWLANVEGEFVKAEAGQLFTLEAVSAAELRWEEAPADGPLVVGVDPAGDTHDGDESAFAVRRSRKVLALHTRRGLSPDGILEEVRGLIRAHRSTRDHDVPLVVVDRDGPVGARVYDVLNAYRLRDERTEKELRVVGFRGGDSPRGRLGEIYRYTRDALFGGLVDAFREGLAIPVDAKLEAELVSLRWDDGERGRSRLVPKSEIKDRLGRSPDRLDALALCTWTDPGANWKPATIGGESRAMPVAEAPSRAMDPYAGAGDPYGGLRPWGGGR